MLNMLKRNKGAIALVALLVVVLAGIRFFEASLFYDPFLDFFKGDFQEADLPQFDSVKLFWGLLLRYLMNTVVSLAIIYVIFKDFSLVKFSAILYLMLFLLLVAVFFGLLHWTQHPDYRLLFYIRRFLIQPLFLVLFLPAFYYQKKVS
ncbi:exosortase F system-associated membrane protein [Flavobacterium suncheonense]|uniref:Membrane protein n=1 Tax=Flavobacterium suncheonense GH29-5 = DSM 17707 TaxID=1121899 RepID=A0A0A2MBS3_9FLAO|nr:membrane protein [Flavobacterium suncheonense GH29-5 = DSM 17707]